MPKLEAVRLIIWDLDETLWRGTLTEGGITEHVAENYSTVRELARRGIISSICSKNDFEPVKTILVGQRMWDYFVFPSISWAGKGPRVRRIVEAAQLRPETVMFIDDNPSNCAEVAAACPGIQVANETIVPTLLEHALFVGKDDATLTRLAQYRLLEQRNSDRKRSDGNNDAFLRASNIRVWIEHDVRPHLDRAIELVNRTNQLNFTKRRLSENIEEARSELLTEMSEFDTQSGLIHVADNYGDYGFVGFYLVKGNAGRRRLTHFCFSCRTLGMEVERWVYDILQRPRLDVVGEVVTDIQNSAPIDWVRLTTSRDSSGPVHEALPIELRFRGGCELDPLIHYFAPHVAEIRAETSIVRGHLFVRKNSTSLLSLNSGDASMCVEEHPDLAYVDQDFATGIFDKADGKSVFIILSMWTDAWMGQYRQRVRRYNVPSFVIRSEATNLCKITEEQLDEMLASNRLPQDYSSEIKRHVGVLRNSFDYDGRLSKEELDNRYAALFSQLPPDVTVFLILPSEFDYDDKNDTNLRERSVIYNNAVTQVASGFGNVHLVRVDDYILDDSARKVGFDHFDREVYYRLWQAIDAKIRSNLQSPL